MCICKYESKEFKTEVFDQQAKWREKICNFVRFSDDCVFSFYFGKNLTFIFPMCLWLWSRWNIKIQLPSERVLRSNTLKFNVWLLSQKKNNQLHKTCHPPHGDHKCNINTNKKQMLLIIWPTFKTNHFFMKGTKLKRNVHQTKVK